MSRNKRYTCKFAKFGCGGSCYGLKRIRDHEETCRYAPAGTLITDAMKARLTNLADLISGLVQSDQAKGKQIKRMAEEIKNLRVHVMDLESTVSRLVPDYSHIKLEFLHLPRYIMAHSEKRAWAEKIRSQCKYDNPKYIFEVFLKHLMENEPFFFRVKSYDALEVSVSFGQKVQGRMLLRDFVVKYMEVCHFLMTSLWPDLTEVNKVPHVPRVLCCGYTEAIVNRLERGEKYVEAQWARTHRAEIVAAHAERVDGLMELVRQEFSSKYKRNSTSK